MPIAFYCAATVVLITGISHLMLSSMIAQVRNVSSTNPARLRGVTKQAALVTVMRWERTRRRLWFFTAVVAGGLVLAGFSAQV